jgi:hypothetical protein
MEFRPVDTLGGFQGEASAVGFDPDEPGIPAGQPGGGEWTTGGESTAEAADSPTNATAGSGGGGTDAASNGPTGGNDIGVGGSSGQIGGVDVGLIPAAYQGCYHDEIVELLRQITIAGGGGAVTRLPLTAVDGTTAIADLIIYLPGHVIFVI